METSSSESVSAVQRTLRRLTSFWFVTVATLLAVETLLIVAFVDARATLHGKEASGACYEFYCLEDQVAVLIWGALVVIWPLGCPGLALGCRDLWRGLRRLRWTR